MFAVFNGIGATGRVAAVFAVCAACRPVLALRVCVCA